MARTLYDDLWFCEDCLMAAVNDDFTALDYHYSKAGQAELRMAAILEGLSEWAKSGHLMPDFDSDTGEGMREHSRSSCDCCNTVLHGPRHRFAVLSTED